MSMSMYDHTTKAIAMLATEAPLTTKAAATLEHVETQSIMRVAVVDKDQVLPTTKGNGDRDQVRRMCY